MLPAPRAKALAASTLAALLLLGSLMPQAAIASPGPARPAADPLVSEMLSKVDRWTLHSLDYDLQNLSQPDRSIASTRNVKATDWIESQLASLGLQIEKQAFTYQGLTRHNVIGTLPGTDNTSKEIYVTGAHMDSVPNSPGANDDGTGTSAAIHMAQIMSGYRFKHTIRFGLWNGEEVGFVGSTKWASKAKQEGQEIRLYIGMDMVGFSGKSAKEMWMYSNTQSDPVRTQAAQLNTDYAIGADLTTQNCDCRSTDHKSFWNQGFTAVGTASEQFASMDPTYHKPTDTVSHAMFDNLAVTTSVNLALLATSAVPVGKAQAIDRIDVTPSTPTITADQTQQFTATAYDASNNQVNATFGWSASGGGVDQSGLFTPSKVGVLTVYANVSGKSGSATVTVTSGALAAITVTPLTASIAVGQTQQFTAVGEDAKKNPVQFTPQWAATGGGTIDASGLFTGSTPGQWTVHANSSSIGGTAAVQVTSGGGGIVSLVVDPPTASVRADATQQFKALGKDAQGATVQELTALWTADSGTIDGFGLFTPAKTGRWTVTATAMSLTGLATVTVTPGKLSTLTISPTQAELKVAEAAQFAIAAEDVKGNAITGFTTAWSADAAIGKVDAKGKFTAERAGSGKVRAAVTSEGEQRSAEALVTVKEGGGGGSPPGDLLSQPAALVGILLAVAVAIAAVAALAIRRKKNRPGGPEQQQRPQPGWGGPPQS